MDHHSVGSQRDGGGGGNTFGVQPTKEISLLKIIIIIIIIIIIVHFPYAFHTSALLSSRDIQIGKRFFLI
jgi:hypothetical protein